MTRKEVLAAWGTPNVKVREAEGERWSYWMRDGRQRIVGRAYVLFDADGRVTEVVEREARGAAPPDPREPVTISAAPSRPGEPRNPSWR
ncbi:MAG: hypothetical protein H0V09_07025 [Gemmatimonadetes bacterium]|nr:hypothetical protein [Gemmatimonadota bacterium]